MPADKMNMSQALERILEFLSEIGLEAESCSLPDKTFLPGIRVTMGKLQYDPEKLLYPGDLLHEAGHLAVLPPEERETLDGDLGNEAGNEMAAIAWSFAACTYLGLDLELLFHPDGYKGDSESLIANFSNGDYFGVPVLEWRGMTTSHGEKSYPGMMHWLCP